MTAIQLSELIISFAMISKASCITRSSHAIIFVKNFHPDTALKRGTTVIIISLMAWA
jgi:hypothetical protein